MIGVEGLVLSGADTRRLRSPLIGGVILFGRNFDNTEQLTALCRAIRAAVAPRSLLIAVDQEGGTVQRLGPPFSQIPAMRTYGHLYDREPERACQLLERTGWLLALELRAVGIDLTFAPVVDLDYGISQVIGSRALHRSPDLVICLAEHLLKGLRAGGMFGVIKHYPGHGGIAADSHLELPVDNRTLQQLMESDMQPFKALVQWGVRALMAAHVRYPQVDAELAGFSPYWLQTILRRQWQFTGAIFSDCLTMAAAESLGSLRQRASAALKAGCDMLLFCHPSEEMDDFLLEYACAPDAERERRLGDLMGVSSQWDHDLTMQDALRSELQTLSHG